MRSIAALVSCTLVAGCLYDWSTGGAQQKDAGGAYACAGGNCNGSCVEGHCDFALFHGTAR